MSLYVFFALQLFLCTSSWMHFNARCLKRKETLVFWCHWLVLLEFCIPFWRSRYSLIAPMELLPTGGSQSLVCLNVINSRRRAVLDRRSSSIIQVETCFSSRMYFSMAFRLGFAPTFSTVFRHQFFLSRFDLLLVLLIWSRLLSEFVHSILFSYAWRI